MGLINYVIYQDKKANGHCRMTVSAELKEYNRIYHSKWDSPLEVRLSLILIGRGERGCLGHNC